MDKILDERDGEKKSLKQKNVQPKPFFNMHQKVLILQVHVFSSLILKLYSISDVFFGTTAIQVLGPQSALRVYRNFRAQDWPIDNSVSIINNIHTLATILSDYCLWFFICAMHKIQTKKC